MQSLGQFTRDEKGAVTVEFTVLVPFVIFLFVFFVDAAVIYLTHSEMYNVARDAARRMATGELENSGAVTQYASEHLFLGQRTYNVYTVFGVTSTVLVEIPVGQAAIFGMFFRPIIGESLIATANVVREPRLVEVD